MPGASCVIPQASSPDTQSISRDAESIISDFSGISGAFVCLAIREPSVVLAVLLLFIQHEAVSVSDLKLVFLCRKWVFLPWYGVC